ncbi:hydrogenase maturation protease [Anoxybacterium hadale]|uniref:Hydrogenase maturation protease n=1 Tax=Anoxybacterium hadale TaxID=3408580 RepID=A0ACD1ADS1_9FIRM|nr:hydrogenase maturation protease [Clostridiales bacterium]
MEDEAALKSGAMKPLTVLGIGNRLMEDDGIGNYVVKELRDRESFPMLRLEEGETDTEFCLDVLEETERIILIDAAHTGNLPGTVSVFQMDDEFFRGVAEAAMAHNYSILQAMKTYGCERAGLLIGIEAASVNCRIGLSEVMKEKFPRIVDVVAGHIENYLL